MRYNACFQGASVFGRCLILEKMSYTRLYVSHLKLFGFIYISNISSEDTKIAKN